MVAAAAVASAGASAISWPQLWAMAPRLCLAASTFSAVALSSWMIMLPRLPRPRIQQLADLLDHVGPADLGGGRQGVAEHLAGPIGLACVHQQLAQTPAHGGDPVGSLQAAEDLERLDQPGEGRLVVLPGEVDPGQVPAGR